MSGLVLELSGIEKGFGGTPVLRGVTLEVERGHVHALLGENGAGKSTLMGIVLGALRADGGHMRLGGEPYRPSGPAAARRAGVVMVPQERTLCPDLTVAENVVLGIEPARGGVLRRAEARTIAQRALAMVTDGREGLDLDERAGALGVADQQLVEIARALAQGGVSGDGLAAKLLVLDEPTSSLGKADAARPFARVRTLKEAGLAVVLVTHFLTDVREHADRYTVLRDGTVQGQGDPRDAPPARIVREMLGRELEGPSSTGPAGQAGEVLLELVDVAGARRPARASLVLRRGEVLGIAGLVGAGRTELLRIAAGLDRPRSGEVRVHAPKGIGLLSEDRGGEGLMLGRPIAENVALSRRGPRLVRPAATLREGARWIGELAIRAAGPEQAVGELSGGNQQKVQLARLLREDYDVLLVDEPTRGIDVASKAQVLGLLRELARTGKGVLLVSSQLEELVSTCDRIAVLRRGVLEEARPAAEWDEQRLLLEAAS